MKKYHILYSFILLTLISCTNQAKNELPSNFTEVKIPETFSKEWYELNHSNDDYLVKNENGQLIVKSIEPKNGTELKINGGKLIGKNYGEWGGELLFQSDDKKIKPLKIKEGNILKIYSVNNKIYFIEGIAHLSISEGGLFELYNNQNNFTYKKLIHFPDAPEAFQMYKGKIYLASHKNFYVIEGNKESKIFEDEFWGSLYPNSIAVFDNDLVFIGMRSGIAKVNLKTKLINFYRENK